MAGLDHDPVVVEDPGSVLDLAASCRITRLPVLILSTRYASGCLGSKSLNNQLRKIIKNPGHFPHGDPVVKLCG